MASCNTTLEQLPSFHWNMTFGVSIALVSILALIENGFIIVVFNKYPKLKTSSNKILVSVVTADCLTGLLVGPLYSIQLLNPYFLHYCFVHKVRRGLAVIFMGASLMSIVLLTVDRSLRLIKLNQYSMTNKWLYLCIFFCWLLPVVPALVGLINEKIHSTMVLLIGVSVIVTIIVCYWMMINALRHQRRKMADKKNALFVLNERKAGKTVIVIITCYLVMLLPLFIEKGLFGFKIIDSTTGGRAEAHMFTILLFIANSNINPLIYATRLPAMKESIMMLCGIVSRKRSTSSNRLTKSLVSLSDSKL